MSTFEKMLPTIGTIHEPGGMRDLDDPYAFYTHLRAYDPVHRLGESPFHLVATWDLIADVVSRPREFSSNLTATMVCHDDGTVSEYPIAELGSAVHVLATADGALHRAHRSSIMPSLVASQIEALGPIIADTVAHLWDSSSHEGRIDWVRDVAAPLPMIVIAELLGFPVDDIDDLVRWSFASTVLLDGVVTADQLSAAGVAVGELAGHIANSFDAARHSSGENVMGDLADLVNRGDLDHDTAIMMLIQLVAAGAESTVSLLGSAVWLLGRNPEVMAALRADRGLVPAFVDEAARLESPFRGHYRHVVEDTELGGVELAAGSHLYLLWGSANRDPAHLDRPDEIVLDRSRRRPHLAFGKGLHLCVGAALARQEVRSAIDLLLERTSEVTVTQSVPQWERSLMTRRLTALPLRFR